MRLEISAPGPRAELTLADGCSRAVVSPLLVDGRGAFDVEVTFTGSGPAMSAHLLGYFDDDRLTLEVRRADGARQSLHLDYEYPDRPADENDFCE